MALEQAALEQQGVEEVHHHQYLKTTHEYIFLREPRQRVLRIILPDPLSLNKVVKMSWEKHKKDPSKATDTF
jgi:hypothetical protein